MKFLCDVHIPFQLVNFLSAKGHEVIHVNTLEKKWFTTDEEICVYADKNNFILITKDSDFRKSFILKKSPRRLIRITLGNTSNTELIKIFDKHFKTLSESLNKDVCYIELSAMDVLVIYSS